jgi:Na+/proline symporter
LILGNFVGYWIISQVLLPVYYKRNLISIYGYLEQRFGKSAQKTGALFFLISRLTGAAARLYLAAMVLHHFVAGKAGFHFHQTVLLIIVLMLVYTWRGGIKTLVWTDCFQSLFLLAGMVAAVWAMGNAIGWNSIPEVFARSSNTKIFEWSWSHPKFFPSEFLSGILLAVAMTGLDQNMMQKNLSCRNLGDAQKNLQTFSFMMVLVNMVFLALGVLLFEFAKTKGIEIPGRSDHFFPMVALEHLGAAAAIFFVLGLTAATFSSADSVLTTLTTSFYLDFLHRKSETNAENSGSRKTLYLLHLGFAAALFATIMGIALWDNRAVIVIILTMASYTYGPLLGLFFFGLWTRRNLPVWAAPVVCILTPLMFLAYTAIFKSSIGNLLLFFNAGATFLFLWFCSARDSTSSQEK